VSQQAGEAIHSPAMVVGQQILRNGPSGVVQRVMTVPETARIILLPQVPGTGFESREHILTPFAEEVMARGG
jgi:hypothetical protein